MKRLREDIDSPNPLVAKAARMVADLGPLPESDLRSERVLRAINQKKQLASPRFSRPLLAAMIVMGAAATAGAALGVSSWLTSRQADTTAPDSALPGRIASTPVPPSSRHIEPNLVVESTDVSRNESGEGKPNLMPVDASGVAGQSLPPKQSVKEKTPSSDKPRGASLSSASQAALVQQAVEALRHSNNPAQAAALLKEYRLKAPSGALAEEALALSIEVAVAQGSAQAQIYAAQYLKLYPSGRFRALAQRTLH